MFFLRCISLYSIITQYNYSTILWNWWVLMPTISENKTKELTINAPRRLKLTSKHFLLSKRNQEARKWFEDHGCKMSLSWHLEERQQSRTRGRERNYQYITYFFVSEDDASIYEQGCLEREASQVVIILEMYVVPLDHKCCAYTPIVKRRNAMRKTYVSILVGVFTKMFLHLAFKSDDCTISILCG